MTVYDTEASREEDLGTQFFLREEDVISGRRRDLASREKLAELNEYVPVSVLRPSDPSGPIVLSHLDSMTLAPFQVIVLADQGLPIQLHVNSITRASGSALISAEVRGLFALISNDFGDSFVVSDTTGEASITGVIAGISVEPSSINKTSYSHLVV